MSNTWLKDCKHSTISLKTHGPYSSSIRRRGCFLPVANGVLSAPHHRFASMESDKIHKKVSFWRNKIGYGSPRFELLKHAIPVQQHTLYIECKTQNKRKCAVSCHLSQKQKATSRTPQHSFNFHTSLLLWYKSRISVLFYAYSYIIC